MSGARQQSAQAGQVGEGTAASSQDRLRGAAVAAFAARGFHGTTTRDIAAAAGMSPAALYVHHRSKEELLHRLALDGHTVSLRLVEEAVAAHTTPSERLAAVVRTLVRQHAVHHTSARIMNYELAALEPAHREEVLAVRRRIDAHVRRCLEDGVASGELHTDSPRTATVLVLSLLVDVARWYDESGELSPEELGDFYAGSVLAMLGAAP